jgi:hypothetical protein
LKEVDSSLEIDCKDSPTDSEKEFKLKSKLEFSSLIVDCNIVDGSSIEKQETLENSDIISFLNWRLEFWERACSDFTPKFD